MRDFPKICGSRLTAVLMALLLTLPLPLSAAKKLTEDEAREKYGLHATVKDEWAIAAWEWVRDHAVAAYQWGREKICGMLFDDMGVDAADQVGLAWPVFIALMTAENFSPTRACSGSGTTIVNRAGELL